MAEYMDIEQAFIDNDIEGAIQHMQSLDPSEQCLDFATPFDPLFKTFAFNTPEKIAVLAYMPAIVKQLGLPCDNIDTPEKRLALRSVLEGKELTHIHLCQGSLTEANFSLLEESLLGIPNVIFHPNLGQAMDEPDNNINNLFQNFDQDMPEPSVSSDTEQETEQGSDASLSSESDSDISLGSSSDEDYWQDRFSSRNERGGGWSRGGR